MPSFRSPRVALVLAVFALGLVGAAMPVELHHDGDRPFAVRALVLTTFAGEEAPWLTHEHFDRTINVAGAFAPLHCQPRTGICVTMTGTTKANAGPSTMALVDSRRLRFDQRSLFIVDGISGIRSSVGTLGTVGIADWIVDIDLGSHLQASEAPPDGWLPFEDYPQGAQHLDPALVTKAYAIGQKVRLTDDATARAERAYYGPVKAAAKPKVQRCDTGASDGFWVGSTYADKADRISTYRIRKVDPTYSGYRCSSEFEDSAIAGALARFGYRDQLVVVRTASDLEDQRPGTTSKDLYDLLHSADGYAGYGIAVENGYRVSSAIAHTLVRSHH